MTKYNSQSFDLAKLSILFLLVFMAVGSLVVKNDVYGNFKSLNSGQAKNLYQSQFTMPPSFSSASLPKPAVIPNQPRAVEKKRCNSKASDIKNGILCYQNKQFSSALAILYRVKSQAIKQRDSNTLLQFYLYKALIHLKQKRNPVDDIKHLFFLNADYKIKGNPVIPKQFQQVFIRIKNQGRQPGDVETDDFSNQQFVYKKHCTGHCRDGLWQAVVAVSNKVSNTDQEILCSLNGTCDDDLNCSLNGTCDSDLDCSIRGDCK